MQPRDLSGHVAYEAGRGLEEVARDLDVDPADLVALASNENPHGPSPAAAEAIRAVAGRVQAYPKAGHADLREAIAGAWDLPTEAVWLANGGDGAIDYLSRAFLEPGDGVLVPDPGFAYYGMSARYHHGTVGTYPLERDRDFAITAGDILSAYDGQRLVYVTTPHNPTGATASLEAIEAVASGTDPETLVVVDEAYGEFASGPSARTLLAERSDVAVLRTFSKAYGLAGVRLGYALVPPEWADAYARVNTPFAVSEVACRAGLAALEDDAHLERSVETAAQSRSTMRREIEAPVWPSAGNFVLVDVGDAPAVTEALAERGVIVRDCSSFGLPDCVRITCGTEADTGRAVSALNAVLAEGDRR